MAEKSCTGDCLRCSMQQQVYCAAQRSYAIMENQRTFADRLDGIEKALGKLADPGNIIPLDGGAQKNGGADNRPENE